MRILVVNGPNLDRLGTRQPEIYGSATLADVEAALTERASTGGHTVEFLQSADPGLIADALRGTDADGVIFNPASLTHHSRAVATAVAACPAPVIEVHISNIAAREPYRRRSMVAPMARGSIVGLGVSGYLLALEHFLSEDR